ncbi:MAG: hypothetical protein DRP78_03030 [Candidatus Omnitrophota bacterium]|nr:MAG: hypothetical protein DRP78_03030 [Candidatus Omnitrophota bacterium]
MKENVLFISNWSQGNALSGGDRIWIELAKRWRKKCDLEIFCSEEGFQMCKRSGAADLKFTAQLPRLNNNNLLLNILRRTFYAIQKFPRNRQYKIIYSTSDFWPDALPAFINKWKNPQIKWIAGFYLFAPYPWLKNSPYKAKRFLVGLFYWLSQLPIYWIVKRYADVVFVTSEPDVKKFITKRRGSNRVIVIQGGIDVSPSFKYLRSSQVIPKDKRKYDACFVGRLHYQKGIIELIDIWSLVCKKKADALLVVIGVGPLEDEVKRKIAKFNLDRNIVLCGFKDGVEKYEIFQQSKIVVHPATYDSGGMAACEAMAWGLPGVSFDLEALKTYYPKGMVKSQCYDLNIFAENILHLLNDKQLYKKNSRDAIIWAQEWDWDKKSINIYDSVIK